MNAERVILRLELVELESRLLHARMCLEAQQARLNREAPLADKHGQIEMLRRMEAAFTDLERCRDDLLTGRTG